MKRVISLISVLVLTVSLFPFFTVPVKAATTITETWTGSEGDLYQYHKHTKGAGVPIVIMPVHFGAVDLAAGGKLETASKWAADLILDAEIFEEDGLIDYLDIYIYLRSDAVYPVPQQGYVDRLFEMWEIVHSDIVPVLSNPKAAEAVRMIYLGNCDEAGQVGGHAYLGVGAMLSWGNSPVSSAPYEPNPSYWVLHEFIGHSFLSLEDEYDNGNFGGPSRAIAPNLYVSSVQPNSGNVYLPWWNFIGYQDAGQKPHGVYGRTKRDSWRATEDGFMNGNPSMYVPMYHKWLAYEQITEMAGTPATLDDFVLLKGITLPNGTEEPERPDRDGDHDGTIFGIGTVNNPTINVVLPLELDFVINPWQLGTFTGNSQIMTTDYIIANKSNAPVLVSFDIEATVENDTQLVASLDELNPVMGETSKKLYLGVLGASGVNAPLPIFTIPEQGSYVYNIDANTAFVPFSATETSSNAEMQFLLGAATGEPLDTLAANNKGVASFQFYGELNTYAPWKTGDVKVVGEYTISGVRNTDYATASADIVDLNVYRPAS